MEKKIDSEMDTGIVHKASENDSSIKITVYSSNSSKNKP